MSSRVGRAPSSLYTVAYISPAQECACLRHEVIHRLIASLNIMRFSWLKLAQKLYASEQLPPKRLMSGRACDASLKEATQASCFLYSQRVGQSRYLVYRCAPPTRPKVETVICPMVRVKTSNWKRCCTRVAKADLLPRKLSIRQTFVHALMYIHLSTRFNKSYGSQNRINNSKSFDSNR